MSTWTNYLVADSLEQALTALREAPGSARPVAGGTDLLLEIQQGRREPVDTLVDVSRIDELLALERRDNRLFIGAAVPVAVIAESPLVREHAEAVAEAAGLIGGPQVRNSATLGGNVAHALPAADGMIGLAAIGATAEVASERGLRRESILSLFRGPGTSTLSEREILVGFYLPLRAPGEASAFARIMRPQGVALPILNAAVWMRRGDEVVEDIRITVGPSGPVPVRASAIEEIVAGRRFDDTLRAEARAAVRSSFRFRTSALRAGAGYRFELCEVLLDEVMRTAYDRAALSAVGTMGARS